MAGQSQSSSRVSIRMRFAPCTLEAPHVFVEDLSVASITQAKVNYQTTDLPQKLSRHHAHVDATFWGWNDIWLDPDFRTWNIEGYLAAIRCPVLCIQGEEDEYGTIAQVEAIKAQVPQTEIMILPNCKHSPHRDQPERTLERMVEFVARQDTLGVSSRAQRSEVEGSAVLPCRHTVKSPQGTQQKARVTKRRANGE